MCTQANDIALSFHRVIAVRLSLQTQLQTEEQNQTSPDAPATSPQPAKSPPNDLKAVQKQRRTVLRYESLSSSGGESEVTTSPDSRYFVDSLGVGRSMGRG